MVVGGKEIKLATHIGKVKIQMNDIKIYLKRVLFVPNFGKKIISINRILDGGGVMQYDENEMVVRKNKYELVFKKGYNTILKYLVLMRTNQKLEVNLTENETMDVNTAHEVFGHPCIENLKMTADMQNITLKGEAKP